MNIQLIEKILSGSATKTEEQAFENWLNELPENRVHFEQMQLIWKESNRIPQSVTFDENKAKSKIRNEIQRRGVASSKRIRRIWISSAASVLLLLGIGTIALKQSNILWPEEIHYSAQNSQKEIELPDGTHVWLNVNSTLTAPVKFLRNKRSVELTGEAYFEVARDESRPFKIRAGQTTTQVLGTSFNIKMDTIRNKVSVVVNTGKVAFYQSGHKNEGVVLLPGDMAGFLSQNKQIEKSRNPDLNYLAWKTHILTFQNTPLKEVCNVLTHYYKKQVLTVLTDPNYVITGKFEGETLENILATIGLTLDVEVKTDASQIIICK